MKTRVYDLRTGQLAVELPFDPVTSVQAAFTLFETAAKTIPPITFGRCSVACADYAAFHYARNKKKG